MVPILFGAFSCGLIYLLVLKLVGLYADPERKETIHPDFNSDFSFALA